MGAGVGARRDDLCGAFVHILKDADFFGALGALNLDLESATGQCVAPLTTTQRFYAKVRKTPR